MIFFSHRFVASFNFWWGIPRFSIFEKKSDFVSISRTRKRNWPITDRSGHNLKMDFHSAFCTEYRRHYCSVAVYLRTFFLSTFGVRHKTSHPFVQVGANQWSLTLSYYDNSCCFSNRYKKIPLAFFNTSIVPKLLRCGRICEKNRKNSTLNYIIDV